MEMDRLIDACELTHVLLLWQSCMICLSVGEGVNRQSMELLTWTDACMDGQIKRIVYVSAWCVVYGLRCEMVHTPYTIPDTPYIMHSHSPTPCIWVWEWATPCAWVWVCANAWAYGVR